MSSSARITNAQLAERLDTYMQTERERHGDIQDAIVNLGGKNDEILKTVQTIQISMAVADTERSNIDKRLTALEAEAKTLGTRVKWTNILEAFVAILLGIFGINR